MPFEVKPRHCTTCSHGHCVSYIRELSKKMKDRDTQYRLAQNVAMACTFDQWVPGLQSASIPATQAIDTFLEQVVANARTAGGTLEASKPNHFGATEKPFFLTEAQIGKVRGDVFETLCRTILWNCCVEYNKSNRAKTSQIAVLSLGDNYDLRKLFTKESGKSLSAFIDTLNKRGISLSYSTPDLVVIDICDLPHRIQAHFSQPITNLSINNQERMNKSREEIAGIITPKHVRFACGLKTSIRSDRMFQFLFEANAWKFVWRRVFNLSACPYHSITSQTFGADPTRLRSIDFSAVGGPESATRAIDSVTEISSPKDLQTWFQQALDHSNAVPMRGLGSS